MGSGSSPGYGGKKARRKEVLEVSEVPRAEFLIPESYEAEPDCAPAGAISGFTFVNFVLSAASVAANLLSSNNIFTLYYKPGYEPLNLILLTGECLILITTDFQGFTK